jgi:phosphatidylglycerophosphate synthase
MLDRHIRPLIDPPLNSAALVLANAGVRANTLTATGFAFALCGFLALALQAYSAGILFILLNRLMDGLDGPLARRTNATDLGGYLDIVSDFIFYSGTVLFFAVGRPEMALPAAVLIFSFIGTSSSFLAYAIVAAKRGQIHSEQGQKSFFYLGGLAEGTESTAVLLLICLMPNYFSWIAYIFAALCWLTALGRVQQAMNDFGDGQ